MYFSTVVVRNLTRRPIRVILVVLASSIAVGAMVALVGISESFARSFASILQDRGVDIVVMEDKSQQMSSRIPESFGQSIQQVAGVREVGPSLVDVIAIENTSMMGVPVSGWKPGSYLFDRLKMIAGESIGEDDRRGVILGQGIAEVTKKKPGDRMDVEGMEFHVRGIYFASNVLEQNGIIMALRDMQDLVASPGSVTGFSVVMEDSSRSSDDVQRVMRDIESLPHPEGSHFRVKVQATDAYLRNSNEMRSVQAMAWLTSMISLIVGAIGMFNAMLTFVYERTREFGVLRALGWRRRRLITMVLYESCGLSLLGSLSGVVGAVILTRLLSIAPQVRGYVDGTISISVMLQGICVGTLVGLLGGVYPAYLAGKMLPSEVIRHE
jgi:putative ABC transport system permease protein